jgi:hypothetical protein
MPDDIPTMRLPWGDIIGGPEKTCECPCPECGIPAKVDRGCLRGTVRITCTCGYSCVGMPGFEDPVAMRDVAHSGPPMMLERKGPGLRGYDRTALIPGGIE